VLTRVLKTLARSVGLQVRRAPDPSIPFLRTIRCDGESFPFWIANEHARSWWDQDELPMNAEFRSLKEMCPPGSTVLDVGAHHGMDSVLLARWAGTGGHVYALEASPENALVLNANIAVNRLTNCTGIHTAVGATTGTVPLAGETVTGPAGSARKVPMTTLDAFCSSKGLSRVDLVKIDVEGYEGEVLRGAREVLSRPPALALELHLDLLARYGTSAAEVLSRLDLAAYRVEMMKRPDWFALHPYTGADDLPPGGIVNLFCRLR
jgi:FkbM family methyltransferase